MKTDGIHLNIDTTEITKMTEAMAELEKIPFDERVRKVFGHEVADFCDMIIKEKTAPRKKTRK